MWAVESIDPAGVDETSFAPWWDVVLRADEAQQPGWVLEPLADQVRELRTVPPRDYGLDVAGVRDPADGHPVGLAITYLPRLDNTSTLLAEFVAVDPSARRHGIGSALLGHLSELAAAERRSVIAVETVEALGAGADSTPGGRALLAAGAVPVALEVRRSLDLTRVVSEPAVVADGYELVAWTDSTPEELVSAMVDLRYRMSVDAPAEDRSQTPEIWDAERIRSTEQQTRALGRTSSTVAARHRATGELVGYTAMGVNASHPGTAFQWDTLVLEGHRGHGLGSAMKLANLRRFRELSPDSRVVHTWNAAINSHMIAINARLGFQPSAQERTFEIRLPAGGSR